MSPRLIRLPACLPLLSMLVQSSKPLRVILSGHCLCVTLVREVIACLEFGLTMVKSAFTTKVTTCYHILRCPCFDKEDNQGARRPICLDGAIVMSLLSMNETSDALLYIF
ncbi:hypothetical protein M422DRAFT_68045 [Sphaerobolus stellatus SS14]|uniref:Secreted protein n=1 Tax=Sphaerobolus stellatus (strain SS14) TaxID=990650 RepID=A0A0C9V5L5_SPHS4|nr:hypothetical protein M422DRAFT_68045 [Sphaerobolus stellatus SS14]